LRITRHPVSGEIKEGQPDHGYRQTLAGRQTVPICRLGRIALGADSLQLKCCDVDLCRRHSLLRGLFEPLRGFLELLGKPLATRIQASERELRFGMPRFRCHAIPSHRLDHVRRPGLSQLVKAGEPPKHCCVVRPGQAMFRRCVGRRVPRLLVTLQNEECEAE
jgi:hypothetical protein